MFLAVNITVYLVLFYLFLEKWLIKLTTKTIKKNNDKNINYSGSEIIYNMLFDNKINDVKVESISKELSKQVFQMESAAYYDMRRKVICIREQIFNGKSLIDIAISAHEVAHAIQDKTKFILFKWLSYFDKPQLISRILFPYLFCIQVLFAGINIFIMPIETYYILFILTNIINILLLLIWAIQLFTYGLILFIEINANNKAFNYLIKNSLIHINDKKLIKKIYNLNLIHVIKNSFVFYK